MASLGLTKLVDGVVIPFTDEEEAAYIGNGEAMDLDLARVRPERNGRLAGTDWTQTVDAPLTAEKQAEWAVYRQALRDYPSQSDRVSTLPDWPTPPS